MPSKSLLGGRFNHRKWVKSAEISENARNHRPKLQHFRDFQPFFEGSDWVKNPVCLLRFYAKSMLKWHHYA
jgi:hypothetical protein